MLEFILANTMELAVLVTLAVTVLFFIIGLGAVNTTLRLQEQLDMHHQLQNPRDAVCPVCGDCDLPSMPANTNTPDAPEAPASYPRL